jgi:TonB family protein
MITRLLSVFALVGRISMIPASPMDVKHYNRSGTGSPSSCTTQVPTPGFAQLVGRVVNERGEPLPGVTITVQGSPTLLSTNAEGRFLVSLLTADATLVFRSPGYRVQTVKIPATSPLTVTLYALNGNGTDANTAKAGETVAADGSVHLAALPYADEMPEFVGGDLALHQYLVQKTIYPAEAKRRNRSGTVVVRFVVDEQGRITDAEVAKGCGEGFDEEALRLIRLMPWWKPGRQAGQPVRVVRTMPIIFRLSH